MTGDITEFPIPSPTGSPINIAVGPDRNIWFTKGSLVGRVTPDGAITEFPLPTPNGGATGLTAGSDRQPPGRLSNRLWVAESAGNKLAFLSFKVRVGSGGRLVAFGAGMFSLLRRAPAKLNRHLGMSFGQTYLYRLSKADGWSAAPRDGRLKWELLSPAQVGQLTRHWMVRREKRPGTASSRRPLLHRLHRRPTGPLLVGAALGEPPDHRGRCVPSLSKGARSGSTTARLRGGPGDEGSIRRTLERIVSDCFAEGDCTAWIYTSKQNVASQKGIERAGFGLVTTLHALRMGSHYFPLGGRENALAALQASEFALPDRKRDPRPAFASASTGDRRRGPLGGTTQPTGSAERLHPRSNSSRAPNCKSPPELPVLRASCEATRQRSALE